MKNKPKFTPGQLAAINLRGSNILVSASAGAGKTAVLTERIVEIVLNRKKPVDIDRIVVVTFTRAAAAEMRTRIGQKLSDKLSEVSYEDLQLRQHIEKQLALLSHARITTIDSFCLGIVRNFFYTINLDPAFRIGDTQEMELLMKEVLDNLLEEEYVRGDAEFINMMETFAPGKSDKPAAELIQKLFEISRSHSWPEEWLDECIKMYDISSADELMNSDWYYKSGLADHISIMINQAVHNLGKACDILKCAMRIPGGSDKTYNAILTILEFVSDEKNNIEKMCGIEDYSKIGELIESIQFDKFPGKSVSDEFLQKKVEAKALRDAAKDIIVGLKKEYFHQSPENMVEDIKACGPAVKELVRVAKKFGAMFAAKKEEVNVVDFNDIEHFALKILLNRNEETGEIEYTSCADELMQLYEYILIDEYQDSNDVQETILTSISRERIGQPNMFMVGDVKQSIYQFRLAKPDIFEGKMSCYTDYVEAEGKEGEISGKKILLKRNFRSSNTILRTVNFVFERIMNKEIGNVNYDDNHTFEITAKDNNQENTDGLYDADEPVEVIYVSSREEISDYSKRQMEGLAIAERIRRLTDNGVKYSDIAILLRSMSGWAEELAETLVESGIPAVAEEQKGYFAAREIQVVLSMLKIIDNPRQDIPLTAVLRSVYGKMTDEELAIIRTFSKGDMYQALLEAAKEAEPELMRKCNEFLYMLNSYRLKSSYVSVHDLLVSLYKQNSYLEHMKAMPAGERREGNLMMLAKKALEYEEIDNKGLASFIRYIDRMKKADIDFGEASVADGPGGAVHIMSIHKSKGLEFPVVFVAGMGKQINLADAKTRVPIQSDIGPAPDYFDYRSRVKRKTLLKAAVNRKIINDAVGEELRVLYVALTRAKEKLIMTGYLDKAEDELEKYAVRGTSYAEMLSGKTCYYDWVLPCFTDHPMWYDVSFNETLWEIYDKEYPKVVFNLCYADELIEKEGISAAKRDGRRNELIMNAGRGIIDENTYNNITDYNEYKYPYLNQTKYAVKVSVSEIKHQAAVLEEGDGITASWASTEKPEYVPSFMREKEESTVNGADRGTMYHSLMEQIDIAGINSIADVIEQMKQLCSDGLLDERALSDKIISVKKIYKFCQSNVAKRMIIAEQKGCLSKEQPFVMGVESDRIYPDGTKEEIIIVQGIIDVYFEEEDGIVLLDYKTDRLTEGEEEKLVKRYKAQMKCYSEAIEKATGKNVKEIILYSFSLGTEIKVDIDE